MVDGIDSNRENYSVSVVIATLGIDTLLTTIEHLNTGTIIPSEIIICIPDENAHLIESVKIDNVKVIRTLIRGQVAQRAIGFQTASCDYVMQLDDDIYVERDCVENLLETLHLSGPDVAVSPSLINQATGDSVYKSSDNAAVPCLFFLHGRNFCRPGAISRSGMSYGIDPSQDNMDLYYVDWLPGGCVLHERANLVTENYFPYTGKAYCEDLIHSHLLQRKGCSLIINSKAKCYLEIVQLQLGFYDYFRALYEDFRARKYFVRISSRSSFKMSLSYFVPIFLYVRNAVKVLALRLSNYVASVANVKKINNF